MVYSDRSVFYICQVQLLHSNSIYHPNCPIAKGQPQLSLMTMAPGSLALIICLESSLPSIFLQIGMELSKTINMVFTRSIMTSTGLLGSSGTFPSLIHTAARRSGSQSFLVSRPSSHSRLPRVIRCPSHLSFTKNIKVI